MDTDRQQGLESPLIEDFLDCEQLYSDSDGDSTSTGTSTDTTPANSPPRKSFKRLHIHVDMSTAQYLPAGAHHSDPARIDGLPVCSSGPATAAYSSAEIDPFSAVCQPLDHTRCSLLAPLFTRSSPLLSQVSHVSCVSSFNCPAAPDPTLLTPVSSAGSPPLQHRPQTKTARNYHSQAPTPPSTSSVYYGPYDVSSSSQSPSPMTVNPAVTEAGHMEMTYIAQSPPGSHGPNSPRNDVGPPVDPYLGSYTVSGPTEGDMTHHSAPEFHPYGVDMPVPGAFITTGQQHLPPHMHQRMPSNGQAPVLSHPHPSHFRQQTTPQIGAIEDLQGDPTMFMGNNYPSRAALSPGRRPQSRKKPSPARKPSRTPKTTPRLGIEGHSLATGQFDPEDDEEEELTLRDDAPEDEKFLFELRKQFISEKGKGMWEEMKAKYSERHNGGNWEKAALQMKVSRAVAKYGVWPEKEVSKPLTSCCLLVPLQDANCLVQKQRLKAAWDYVEEKRYALMLAYMKDNGGCRVWDWKPQHIEAMLVKMGLEERQPDPTTGSRRRKQKIQRRQASPQHAPPHNPMGDWHNGLGLHQHPHAGFPGHPHHMAAVAAAQANGGMMPDPVPPMTSEQEDDLIDQVYSKIGKTERSLSPDGDSMDYGYDDEDHESKPAAHNHHQQSERVARQACEQMMQAQAQPGQAAAAGGHFVAQ